MAGLLKQLQRSRSSGQTSDDPLLISTRAQPRSDPPADFVPPEEQLKDESVKEAEALLADLLSESSRPVSLPDNVPTDIKTITGSLPNGPGVKGESQQIAQRIVRRRSGGTPVEASAKQRRDDKLPWWLTEGKKTTPQVEMLVPLARKMLNEILPADGDIKVDLATVLRQAVELASDRLRIEVRVSAADEQMAFEELVSLLTGKGPLQPLYDDPAVTDIFIDNHRAIKCIRRGQAIESPFYFRSKEEYKAYLTAMLQSVDRVLNLSSPIVDCVLNDDFRSRINAVDASLVDGEEPRICIRVPRLQQISFYDLLQSKTMPPSVAAWLAEVVASGEANIMVLGATGSGKTVMTTALLSAVGQNERIITIEDVPEIFVNSAHLEKMVSRPANAQGEGEIKMPQLLRAALRRAPHRIVVGEIRDEEGKLFLRALETGHAGSIATIHAENSRDSLWRLLDVVSAYERAPQQSIMRRIGRALHILITMKKVEGRSCLVEVAEVCTPGEEEFVTQPIVRFDKIVDGKRYWRLMTRESVWIDKVRERGLELKPGGSLLPPEEKSGTP